MHNTFTHKQYTERHKTKNTQNNTNILEECGACIVFAGFTVTFALQQSKRQGKPSEEFSFAPGKKLRNFNDPSTCSILIYTWYKCKNGYGRWKQMFGVTFGVPNTNH